MEWASNTKHGLQVFACLGFISCELHKSIVGLLLDLIAPMGQLAGDLGGPMSFTLLLDVYGLGIMAPVNE